MIADDEIYIRELIKRSLVEDDITFYEAGNGNETLNILAEQKIDLLIIDLVMPHKGGIEALMEIREADQELKVIAITGKIETKRDSVQGIVQQFHLDALFEKPFDMFLFTQRVQELISG